MHYPASGSAAVGFAKAHPARSSARGASGENIATSGLPPGWSFARALSPRSPAPGRGRPIPGGRGGKKIRKRYFRIGTERAGQCRQTQAGGHEHAAFRSVSVSSRATPRQYGWKKEKAPSMKPLCEEIETILRIACRRNKGEGTIVPSFRNDWKRTNEAKIIGAAARPSSLRQDWRPCRSGTARRRLAFARD